MLICPCTIYLCVQVDEKHCLPYLCVINIMVVDPANCNMSEITNTSVMPHIKRSDNSITRVNGRGYRPGSYTDVL